MKKKIVLDAGHGLPDPGAVGYGKEYDYTLKIINEIAKYLPSTVIPIFTRETERGLNLNKTKDLQARCDLSNKYSADLFVSIHLNAFNKMANGYETLVYSSTRQDQLLHSEISKTLKKHGLTNRGIKIRKDLYVLRETNAKAVLLECLFIDNRKDMEKLNTQSFFQEFCQSIAKGIMAALK